MPLRSNPNHRFACLLALLLLLTMLIGAAGARADISFRADYENGSCCVSGGWHDVQYEFDRPMPESFAIVTNPVRQGHYAAKVVVQQGYSPFGWNESTEAASGFSDQGEGTDYYYAWSTMFDASWHTPYGWGDVVQFYTDHYEKFGGPPPVSLDANGSQLTLSVLAGRFDEPGTDADGWRGSYTHPGTSTPSVIGYAYNHNYTVLDTLSPGQWNDFVVHIHWSGRNGLIQIWHRLPGQSWIEVIDAQVPTLRYDPQTNVSDDIGLIKQGFYRQSYCQQPTILTACNSTLGLQPPNILYQDAFVRGSSFDEVAAAAFDDGGSAAAPPPPAPAPAAPAPAAAQSSSPAAPTGPDLPQLATLSPTTDSGCGGCGVSTSRGAGDVDATIAGGLDNVDTAYALGDFGGSSGWSGRVWTRDVVALPPSTALGGNLSILQQRDTSDKLVWEIYVDGSTRQLGLWSPAGGLGSAAINQLTGVAVDGQSHRIEVSALPNNSVVVRVDGQDRITIGGLSGSTSGNLRFLRVGIDHYDTGTASEHVSISHSDVGVSTVDWLGTRVTALTSTAGAAGGTGSAPSGSTGASSGSGKPSGGASGGGPSTTTAVTTTPPKTTKTATNAGTSTTKPSATTVTRTNAAPSARKPVIFVEQPRVAARRTLLVRLATRPRARLQIIVRDVQGRSVGSTYAVSTRKGRSLQLVMLHGWKGQARLSVIVRSHVAGVLRSTSVRVRLSKRELTICRGTH
jgi:hypothetical protein